MGEKNTDAADGGLKSSPRQLPELFMCAGAVDESAFHCPQDEASIMYNYRGSLQPEPDIKTCVLILPGPNT